MKYNCDLDGKGFWFSSTTDDGCTAITHLTVDFIYNGTRLELLKSIFDSLNYHQVAMQNSRDIRALKLQSNETTACPKD